MRVGLAGTLAAAACAAALTVAPAAHAGDIPTVTATPFGGAFDTPVHITGAPGFPDLVYVTQQGGQVRVVEDGVQLEKPLIDLTDLVSFGGEKGLLSTAFPPDFAETGRFYVYYNNKKCNDATGGCDIEIAEFKLREDNPRRARLNSHRTVITIPHRDAGNHNGGTAAFGPDGKLWIATGDGGGGNDTFDNSSRLNELLGKLLRINPKKPEHGKLGYRVPGEEPVRGRKGQGRDLVDRLAQPLPLLVRRRQHHDRRRRPGRPRRGQHRPDRYRQGRRLPVAGARGHDRGTGPEPGDHPPADRADPRLPAAGRPAGQRHARDHRHRRRRRPRPTSRRDCSRPRPRGLPLRRGVHRPELAQLRARRRGADDLRPDVTPVRHRQHRRNRRGRARARVHRLAGRHGAPDRSRRRRRGGRGRCPSATARARSISSRSAAASTRR